MVTVMEVAVEELDKHYFSAEVENDRLFMWF